MTRLRDKKTGQLVTTHGHSKRRSPEYNAWSNMRQRCNNPQATGYSDYGGRGITICSRRDSFEAFLEDMGNKPSPKHSLDRINNADGVGRGNSWADAALVRHRPA